MKFKLLGIQLKSLIAIILSFIFAIIIYMAIQTNSVISIRDLVPTNYPENYMSSSVDLKAAMGDLFNNLNNEDFKNLDQYKKLLKSYESQYSPYKLGFVITDGNNILYNSQKNTKNFNLKKAYKDTIKNAFGDDPVIIPNYYNFTYKFPITLDNKIMELRATAIPIPYKQNMFMDSFFPIRGIFFILLVVVIFYILTLPKVRYINTICKGLNTIANGNLDFRIKKKGNDELSTISHYINHMTTELQQRIIKERELENSKQELITNVAHDIRSPLTSIIGFLDLVKSKEYNSTEEMDKYIDISLKKAETMKKLTNDLFMFTKLNSTGLKFNFSSICFNEIVYQLIDEFEPSFEVNNLKLSDDITSEKILVNVDTNMFARALNNLFSNALKYSLSPYEVKVSLKKDDGNAIFSISNQCEAIIENDINMLFERFYRVDQARSNPDNSSGLGLSISKNIIERHDGSITATCKDNIICFSVIIKYLQ